MSRASLDTPRKIHHLDWVDLILNFWFYSLPPASISWLSLPDSEEFSIRWTFSSRLMLNKMNRKSRELRIQWGDSTLFLDVNLITSLALEFVRSFFIPQSDNIKSSEQKKKWNWIENELEIKTSRIERQLNLFTFQVHLSFQMVCWVWMENNVWQ